jgi:hypothetical protein
MLGSNKSRCVAAAGLAALGMGQVISQAAVIGPTRVILSGTTAPAGGSFSTFDAPVLNASGRLAFKALVFSGSSENGIFVGESGSFQTVALSGTAAPGGFTYRAFNTPTLNDSGIVSFRGAVSAQGGPAGAFVGTPGSVQRIAFPGQPAPAGGNFGGFNDDFKFNAAGQVAFATALFGGTSSGGVFAGVPGSLATVALQGAASPAGGTYDNFGEPALNDSGTVAFRGNLTGGSSAQGIFQGTPGSVSTVARVGDAAPAGVNFAGLRDPKINNAAQVAFNSDLTGGSSTGGIFAGAAGSLQTAALRGAAAPAGGNYDFFHAPVINAAGAVAFKAELTGGSSTTGIFAGLPGSVRAVAVQGDAAPDGPGVFANFANGFPSFNTVAMNAFGYVTFSASLTGIGVTNANNSGLYVGTGQPGQLFEVVRSGDVVDVDPGVGLDLRIVEGIGALAESGGEDGRPSSLNDAGLLTYTLFFTDNTSGIFTSVVPEPASLSLLMLAALAGVRRRRC